MMGTEIGPGALQKVQQESALGARQDQIRSLILNAEAIIGKVTLIADTIFGPRPTEMPSSGGVSGAIPQEPNNIQFLLNRLGERLHAIQVELDRF